MTCDVLLYVEYYIVYQSIIVVLNIMLLIIYLNGDY